MAHFEHFLRTLLASVALSGFPCSFDLSLQKTNYEPIM